MRKFIIYIDKSVSEEIITSFNRWIITYKKYIKTIYKKRNNEKCDFYIKKNDLKHFTKLKKEFWKFITKKFKLKEGEYYYLNNKNLLNYNNPKKRPYLIHKWGTKANNKVILFQISTKYRKGLENIFIKNKKSYINSEEPITKTIKQVFRAYIF